MSEEGGDESRSASRRSRRRTWPQRLTIAAVLVAAIACFGAAAALYGGQRVIEDRNLVTIENPVEVGGTGLDLEGRPAEEAPVDDGDDAESAPVETFPPAEPDAKNFLVTGADNNSCIDPDSPYAAAFGDRSSFGERSDTIMMWRVNPSTSQVAVLSFPRDLWVTIAGQSGSRRINEAYDRDDPQRLIDTIYANFFVPTDHFIQVDFCAFKTLVDAVDGVAVPFSHPVRDEKTGLYVPEPGCFTFDGDHALAYVRSRYLEVYTDDGEWKSDQAFDLGRISRQQDFIRRTVDALLSAGTFNPDVIGGLVETNSDYVVTDDQLTPSKILEFAGVLSGIDPTEITTYQIEARPQTIQGNAVLVPELDGENMQRILQVFRGEAALAEAPDQPAADTPPTTPPSTGSSAASTPPADGQSDEPSGADVESTDPDDTSPDDITPAPETDGEAEDGAGPELPAPSTTLPEVEVEEIIYGFVPDASISC